MGYFLPWGDSQRYVPDDGKNIRDIVVRNTSIMSQEYI